MGGREGGPAAWRFDKYQKYSKRSQPLLRQAPQAFAEQVEKTIAINFVEHQGIGGAGLTDVPDDALAHSFHIVDFDIDQGPVAGKQLRLQ